MTDKQDIEWTEIVVPHSDGQPYDYTIDDGIRHIATNSIACEDPDIDFRWRMMLATWLRRQLAPANDDTDYVLQKLPKNYTLRLTNYYLPKDEKPNPKKDYAIYGHPLGSNIRYRAPGEFVPHLMWLVSGKTDDRAACSCEHCVKMVNKEIADGRRPAPQSGPPDSGGPEPAPGPSPHPGPDNNQPDTQPGYQNQYPPGGASGAGPYAGSSYAGGPGTSHTNAASDVTATTGTTPSAPVQAMANVRIENRSATPATTPATTPASGTTSAAGQVPASHSSAQLAPAPAATPVPATTAVGPARPQSTPRTALQTTAQATPQTAPQATPQAAPQSAPQTVPQAAPAAVATSVLPGTTSAAAVFRTGEMVWYKRDQAWRLGVICGMQMANPAQGSPGGPNSVSYVYHLAPLGHMNLSQAAQTKTAAEMRPFLTFSVPNTNLPQLQDRSYTDIDWPVLIQQHSADPSPERAEQKRQYLGLEASKMAAKCVNNAFSTFNRRGGNARIPANGSVVSHYGGVFFGAELIHVGDPVRIATANDAVGIAPVLRVFDISVTETPEGSALQFHGSVYQLRCAAAGDAPFSIAPQQLGTAFYEEVDVRNRIEMARGVQWGWDLVEQDVVRAEHEVLGRFYVTHRLMQILAPERLQQAMKEARLDDQQQSLNPRGHPNGALWMGRQGNRMATFGVSIGFRLSMPQGMEED